MRIHILFNFKGGPWGGGNQFLKMLKKGIDKRGCYEDNPENADIILLNLYAFGEENLIKQCIRLKEKYPDKIFIQRIDGPISLYRKKALFIDKSLAKINKYLVDGTIFQSNWSYQKNLSFGFKSEFKKTIINAADGVIFNKTEAGNVNTSEKIKLISASWSSNVKKGFEWYKFLDDNLDFNRFEMTFAGNSPIEFNNIRRIHPLSSLELAKLFKEHDVFVTASQNDPCSNTLIEALSCGLPSVALDSGGHPELIAGAGELFKSRNELLATIEKVAGNIEYYKTRIPFNADCTSKCIDAYIHFMDNIFNLREQHKYIPKQLSITMRADLYLVILDLYIRKRVESIQRRVRLWIK